MSCPDEQVRAQMIVEELLTKLLLRELRSNNVIRDYARRALRHLLMPGYGVKDFLLDNSMLDGGDGHGPSGNVLRRCDDR